MPQAFRPQAPTTSPRTWPSPPMATAIKRGMLGRCPACGKSHMFNGFLRLVATCRNCSAPLGRIKADDAPPYFTILITGHIVVPLMMYVDKASEPSTVTMAAIFLPMTLGLSLGLLRPIKGGIVGAMVTLNMLDRGSPMTP